MEKVKVFVQSIKKVGPFTNKETGEIIEGYNVNYFDLNRQESDDLIGYPPSRKFLSVNDGTRLKELGTGLYNIVMKLDLSSNRPQIKVEGFGHIKKLDLTIE